MSSEFYVTVQGSKQGTFKTGTPRERRAGKITALAFHYNVTSPRDAASGMASGRRLHQPVSFVKQWGPSTPQFFQALSTDEVLKSVLFEFVKTNANGEESVFHTVTLTNAVVSEIDQYLAWSDTSPADDDTPLERISLTFQRIEIENKDGKTTAVDDWHRG